MDFKLGEGKESVGCEWALSLKYNSDYHEGRLVANGFTQFYGKDYLEMFFLVVKLKFVRVVVPVVVY